jgi:hypothetical protein
MEQRDPHPRWVNICNNLAPGPCLQPGLGRSRTVVDQTLRQFATLEATREIMLLELLAELGNADDTDRRPRHGC